MEHCDGEIAPKLSNDGRSEDRLSALPDDLLIHILVRLRNPAVAARTSVLSRRWRRLWTLLPELHFPPESDPQHIRLALTAHEAPALQRLDVCFSVASHATPESVAAWLPIAARRLSGELVLVNVSGDEAGKRDTLELPCFENATKIVIELLVYPGLAMPLSGIFARLTDLYLGHIMLRGPSMLGDALSSPRCPALQKLTLGGTGVLGNFTIHSESLLEMKLLNLLGLLQLIVTAPALKLLNVKSCFADRLGNNPRPPVANISAPQLVSLMWWDDYDPRFTQLGKMENLQCLSTCPFTVYGQDVHKSYNSYCTKLLRSFELIHSLRFTLIYLLEDISHQQYLMEDIVRLPDITFMSLDIIENEHSFGASSFHVLRMCTGLRKLSLTFCDTTRHLEAQTACPSGCVCCDQPPNWKTEELKLNCLQEVEVCDLRGTEHEAALLRRLFVWATVLEKMTVTFRGSVAESKAKEFCQMLQSFSRREICLKWQHFA